MKDTTLSPIPGSSTPEATPAPRTFPPLTSAQRCVLKARAHHLIPAVMMGQQGLTDNVLKAITKYLDNNDLIKIRVLSADNETRHALAQKIAEHTQAELVQHIGRQLVFYRLLPKKKKQPVKSAANGKRRDSSSSGSSGKETFSRSTPSVPWERAKPKASFTHKHRTSRFSGR